MYFCFISSLKSGTEISIRFAHYKTGLEPEPTVLTVKTLHIEAKKKNKEKTTESMGNTIEEVQEDGEKCETRR